MHLVNAKQLLCPMPVIRLQSAVKPLTQGEKVEVLCTDPGALHDIPAWCRIHGHQILSTQEENNEIRIVVQVGSS